MSEKTILIVDDDSGHCANMEDILELEGYRPFSAGSIAKGREMARRKWPAVALLDLKLPDGPGTLLLADLKRINPDCYCIIITAHADLDSAVTAMDEGAYYYLRKPFRLDELLGLLKRIFEAIRLRSQKRQAEIALRESEEKLAGIVDAVADAIVMVNEDGAIVWANEKGRKVFGSELEGMPYTQVLYDAEHPIEGCIVGRCFCDGEQHDMEIQIKCAGEVLRDFWCTSNVVLRDKDGRPKRVVTVCRNISEKKMLQAEVMRNAQLAALGELAAGVAHEINNPINGIINYAQIMIDQRSPGGDDGCLPESIIKEGDRIAAIVNKLLSFAANRQDEKQSVMVAQIIDDALDLNQALLAKENILIDIQIPEDLPECLANYQQIQQVILNILSNARYALNRKFGSPSPEKRLTISVDSIDHQGGSMLRLTFTDQGIGIPADIIDKVCNPFFSTKPPDQGTGLGLSISYGIIEDHRGELWIESEPGQYTSIMIELPIYQG